jgi:WD40 repeat protein
VVLDLATSEPIGRPIRNAGGPRRIPVLSLAFAADGRHVLVGDADGAVRVWDPATRTKVAEAADGHHGAVTAVAVSPDGRLAATGGADLSVRLWRPESLEQVLAPMKAHSNWVTSLAFRPGGTQLVSAGQDRTIVFWDVRSGRRVGEPVQSGAGRLRSLAFSPDGRVMYAASEDRTVRQWNLDDPGDRGAALGTVGGPALSVAVRPQGDLVASSSDDGTVVLWKVGASTSELRRPVLGAPPSVSSAAFVADGREIATAQPNGSVRLWDVRTGRALEPALVDPAGEQRRLLAASPRGRLLAVSGPDSVDVWDLGDRSVTEVIPVSRAPSAMAFSPDGRRIAAAVPSPDGDSRVHLWDVGTATMESRQLATDRGRVNDLAFSPDGTRLAAATHDYSLVIWNLAAGTRVSVRTGQAGQMTAVSFVSASLVASGSDDGSVVLTDVRTTHPVGRRMAGHSGRVHALAAAPREGLLASGGDDGNVILWDVPTQMRLGRAVVTFGGAVTAVESSADGATLVSAGDGGVAFTATDVSRWRAQACQVSGRELSADEWRSYVGNGFAQEPLCSGTPAPDGD